LQCSSGELTRTVMAGWRDGKFDMFTDAVEEFLND